mmetsp:Transcript_25359/g.75473  ORF Transcript_25359/g.75473 Transcript_25359/m.75473 type:complete len:217 (+) Transcript_25359:1478-2128(+)
MWPLLSTFQRPWNALLATSRVQISPSLQKSLSLMSLASWSLPATWTTILSRMTTESWPIPPSGNVTTSPAMVAVDVSVRQEPSRTGGAGASASSLSWPAASGAGARPTSATSSGASSRSSSPELGAASSPLCSLAGTTSGSSSADLSSAETCFSGLPAAGVEVRTQTSPSSQRSLPCSSHSASNSPSPSCPRMSTPPASTSTMVASLPSGSRIESS